MTKYEVQIIILLRKIAALSLGNNFDAITFLNRNYILKNLHGIEIQLLKTIKSYLKISDQLNKLSKVKGGSIKSQEQDNVISEVKTQYDQAKSELIGVCKQHNIDINFEVQQLSKICKL